MKKILKETKKEKRSLGEYVTAKLSIPLYLFSEQYGHTTCTLYARWRTDGGRTDIMNAVKSMYIDAGSGLNAEELKEYIDRFNSL